MGRIKDLKGERFGKLKVLESTDKRYHNCIVWRCKCKCGKEVFIPSLSLISGNNRSCGCLKVEQGRIHANKLNETNARKCYEGTMVTKLNTKLPSNNTSGVRGVYWDKKRQIWESYIGLKRKKIRLGYFKNKEDAIKARKMAEERYFEPLVEKYSS